MTEPVAPTTPAARDRGAGGRARRARWSGWSTARARPGWSARAARGRSRRIVALARPSTRWLGLGGGRGGSSSRRGSRAGGGARRRALPARAWPRAALAGRWRGGRGRRRGRRDRPPQQPLPRGGSGRRWPAVARRRRWVASLAPALRARARLAAGARPAAPRPRPGGAADRAGRAGGGAGRLRSSSRSGGRARRCAGPLLARHALRAALPALLLPWALARSRRLRAAARAGARRCSRPRWSTAARRSPRWRCSWTRQPALRALDRHRRRRRRSRVAGAACWSWLLRDAGCPARRGRVAARRRRVRWLARRSCCWRSAPPRRRARPARRARRPAWRRCWRLAGRLLDFDGDGYARLLGGGDCDDGDPDVHPGALDLPGDGIDPTATATTRPARCRRRRGWSTLPAAVPRDLNLLFLVTIDTLRADHLGCYGYARPTSPGDRRAGRRGHAVRERLGARAVDALLDAGDRHRPLAVGDRLGRVDLVAAHRPATCARLAEALHDAGYFTGGLFSFSYFALADRRGFERGMDVLQRRPRRAARRGQRPDGVARLVVARDDRRRDRVRRRAPRPEVLPVGALLRSAPGVRAAPRGAVVRAVARRPLRRRDPLHRPAHRARCSRTCARPGCGTAPSSSSPAITARASASTASPSTASTSTRRRPRCRSSCACPACAPRRRARPGRPRRHRADAGQPGARAAASRASSAARWSRTLARAAGAATPTRAPVFQEVTVGAREEARARDRDAPPASGTAIPGNTTECYDRARDPAEAHDIWAGGAAGDARRASRARARAQAPGRGAGAAAAAPPRRWRAA